MKVFGFRIASRKRSSPGQRQSGYAYLMALFLVIALIISSQAAMQSVLTTGRREREAELIWRGQQYVRAIRLYYRKTGHYPSTLDDLKKGMPELHFLRYAAYKDPMKPDEEGAWRFIYVNAAGQIIGSVRYATLQQMAIMDMNGGKIPGPPQGSQSGQIGIPVSSLADQSSGNPGSANPANANQGNSNQNNGSSAAPDQSAQNGQSASSLGQTSQTPSSGVAGSTPDNSGGAGATPGQNSAAAQPGTSAQNSSPNGSPTATNNPGTPAGGMNANLAALSGQALAALATLKPTGPVDGPVLGGFLTGVASTVDKPSLRIYNGGKKYKEWEFIWNPVEDQAKAVQQGLSNPGAAVAGGPGQAIGNGPAGTSIFGNSAAGPNGSPNTSPNPSGSSFNGPGAPGAGASQPSTTPQ